MTRRTAITAAALAAAVLALAAPADARWSASGAGTPRVGSDTMNNASNFRAVCRAANRTDVDLSWAISTDTYVDGYQIVRTGPGSATASFLQARTTASMRHSGLSPGTYTFTIQSGSLSISWVTPLLPAIGVITIGAGTCAAS
jgi:hypothetical protein